MAFNVNAKDGFYGTFNGNLNGNANTATNFSSNREIKLTGDITGSSTTNTGAHTIATTLANSGVTAGSYGPSANVTGNNGNSINIPYITVDAKGRVTSISNKTFSAVNTTYSSLKNPYALDIYTSASNKIISYDGSAVKSLRFSINNGISCSTTAYDNGAGVELQIYNSGVRSITTGNVYGYFTVNTNGSTANTNILSIASRGRVTGLKNAVADTVGGLSMLENYNNTDSQYPCSYGNILMLKGTSSAGAGQLLIGWPGTSGTNEKLYFRSKRDVADANWSSWSTVYSDTNKPTANDVGALPISGGTLTGDLTVGTLHVSNITHTGTINVNQNLTVNDRLTVTGTGEFRNSVWIGYTMSGSSWTSNGSQSLNVSGDGNFGGEIFGTSIHASSDIYATGSLRVSGTATTGDLTSDSIYNYGTFYTGGNTTFGGTATFNRDAKFNSSLEISGTTRTYGDLITYSMKPYETNKYNIGNSSKYYKNAYLNSIYVGSNNPTSWVKARDTASIIKNNFDTSTSSFSAALSMKSADGSWEVGVYTGNILHFSYITDANYNANNNTQTADIQFRPNGTISGKIAWDDVTSKPTIPIVNNGTLTIQKNGSNVQTFTANQSNDVTANITVPTKTSDITNDSGFITINHTHNYAGSSSAGGNANKANAIYLPRESVSFNITPGANTLNIKEISGSSSNNAPTAIWYHIYTGQGSDANYQTQLALGMTGQAVYYRNRTSASWQNWRRLLFADEYRDTNTTYTLSSPANANTIVLTNSDNNNSGTVTLKAGNNVTLNGGTANEITISSSYTNTDTKVTSVDNHYAPTENTSSQLSIDASSTTAATWNSTSLVTGVDIKRDAKGHVTGIAVDSIKMPANPNTNTTYTLSSPANTNTIVLTPSSGSPSTVTLKAGSNITLTGTTAGEITIASTWRGIQNNLTSDSTSDSLSAAQGKALKTLIDSNSSKINTIGDQRNVATKPSDYKNNLIFMGLKTSSYINNPSSDGYSYLIGLKGWADSSGGVAHELAFNNSGIYRRTGNADTSWNNWAKLLDSSNWNSFITLSSLGAAAATHNHRHLENVYSITGDPDNGLSISTNDYIDISCSNLDIRTGLITLTSTENSITITGETGVYLNDTTVTGTLTTDKIVCKSNNKLGIAYASSASGNYQAGLRIGDITPGNTSYTTLCNDTVCANSLDVKGTLKMSGTNVLSKFLQYVNMSVSNKSSIQTFSSYIKFKLNNATTIMIAWGCTNAGNNINISFPTAFSYIPSVTLSDYYSTTNVSIGYGSDGTSRKQLMSVTTSAFKYRSINESIYDETPHYTFWIAVGVSS